LVGLLLLWRTDIFIVLLDEDPDDDGGVEVAAVRNVAEEQG